MKMEEKIDLILERTEKLDTVLVMQEKVDTLLGMKEKVDKIDELMEMKEKVDKIDELMEMKEKVDKIDELMEMKEIVAKMQIEIKEIREEQDSMNRTLILIQEDTSTKIPALFDGLSFQQQHIEANDQRLDILEAKVDNHSNRLWALEHAD